MMDCETAWSPPPTRVSVGGFSCDDRRVLKKSLRIAVTEFALPAPRTGSIEVHSGYGLLAEKGGEVHGLVQARRAARTEGYATERPSLATFERGGRKFLVAGRLDGFVDGLIPRIEEIKSTANVEELRRRLVSGDDHPYLLQLRSYGYFHWKATGVEPELVLVLASTRTRETEEIPVALDRWRYEAWLERRLDELVVEAAEFEKAEKRRKKAAASFKFPFDPPRRGQLELAAAVERACADGAPLLVQAPTGLGKTAGVMAPALKEALSRGQKLIYVTPKNSQHAAAEDAVDRLQAGGQAVRSLTINAKSKMCFKEETICNPEYCEYARDHYKKTADHGLIARLSKKKNLRPRTFREFGKKYEVCPFELQLETAASRDVIVCDYNYVFSPRNARGRLTGGLFKKNARPNLVIDEAHNLPSRATDYFSPALSAPELAALGPRLALLPAGVRGEAEKALERALELIESARPGGARGAVEVNLDPKPFLEHQEELARLLTKRLESPAGIGGDDPVLFLAHAWSEFAEALGREGEEFRTTFTPQANGGVLRIVCCDAAKFLGEAYAAFANVVAFSATLKPFDYSRRLLGLDGKDAATAEFTSPFPRGNRKLMVIPQVSTKWNDRARESAKIADGIARIVKLRRGNYFVFFPSFAFMEQVLALTKLEGFVVLKQEREMKSARVAEILERLRAADRPTVVFGVQGGVFSEGVDYPGDMLIGVIVVGPALPSFDFERELRRDYYERKYGEGFDYAYAYPAMAKVVQSAGRVIRSETDRGLIVLMDRRFVQDSYVKSMPADWIEGDVRALVPARVTAEVEGFWRDGEEP